ncbi:cell adhesion molecule 3 isoform X2 [Hippocampus zosterae]|uniref:cell adhesion molecule 3 isoform X2 n=1 Tax=Hippocampus zosterae TaxID=109293 RepID=UPI00223CC83A|nr:cell adhesion molecule 3 isoform X2 [Hippocampus zosterae]
MAFPSAPLWIVSILTLLSAVCSNVVFDDDPLQPVTSDETVSVGGAVTLTCRVAESDNSSLQWSNTAQQTLYFGEKRALRDNRIQLHRSTPTELSIIISEVQLSDEGEYTCSIFTMPVRTAHATVTVLGVPGKPHISGLEHPVQEGGTLTLTCTSTGSKPPARLRWFRGDLELQGRPDVVESVPDEPTYNVSSELTLEVSRADDNQVVTCAVDHPSLAPGDKRSEQALQVLYSPNVQILPESDLPREGEKFHLECLGNSNPEPSSYIWEKKDGELPPLAKAEGTFLRFEALNKSDNGVYLCFADNGIGSSVGEYALLVQDPNDPADSTSAPPTFTSTFSSLVTDPTSFTGSPSETAPTITVTTAIATSALSNELFPGLTVNPDSSATPPPFSPSSLTPSVSDGLTGHATPTDAAENIADPTAMSTSSSVDHAVIGGVVAVIVFILLCLLIVFGRYLIRHKGTYLTHEAKGSDDAPDADTAIINAEGGNSGVEDKKEYFI